MIFHLKATSYMKTILTWFSTSRQLYENYFDMIFHLKKAQNLISEHYERDFDMIFHFNAAKNFVADYEKRDFELIF